MLLVQTKIGPSSINGTGLFANQFIPKGTHIWKFQPGFDLKFTKAQMDTLSKAGRDQFLKYSYIDVDSGEYVLCFDDARFFNHADEPNCIEQLPSDEPDGLYVAARDIQIGEELTCDYKDFDGNVEDKLSTKI
jgi:SET domain-containing protein